MITQDILIDESIKTKTNSRLNEGQLVYQHTELVSFLKDIRLRLGEEGSYSRLAHRCGLKSRTEAKKVFLGEKGISKLALEQLAQSLDLPSSAREYLELLRIFEVSTDPEKVWALGQRILRIRKDFVESDRTELGENQLCLLENWWTIPLLHYFDLKDQAPDLHSILKAFRGRVSLVEIQKSIEDLIEYKLLERGSDSKLKRSTQTNVWLKGIPNPLIKRFHQMMILLAHSAVTDSPPENRYVMSTTLPIKKANIENLRERVKSFMEEMTALYATAEAEEVHQLNIQLFSILTPNLPSNCD